MATKKITFDPDAGVPVASNLTIYTGADFNATFDVYNVFIAFQDGGYTFRSYEDFLAKNPSRYSASNSRVGTELGGAAAFDYGFESVFVQDEISISDKLRFEEFLLSLSITISFPFE